MGVRADNKMYMAYDLSERKGYGNPEVEGLSPFLCIGPETKLHPADVESVLANGIGVNAGIESHHLPETHHFRREAVTAALAHPNAEVRRIAQELLDRGSTQSQATRD